jgi:hypothetical protein
MSPLTGQFRFVGGSAERADQAIEYVFGEAASLWHFFKTAQFWQDDTLLILDQFEELFTLQSDANRQKFVEELSYRVRGGRPPIERISQWTGVDAAEGIGADGSLSDLPPQVHVVISMREDFLADMEDLAEDIPHILDQRFRLRPLRRDAAADALVEPARLRDDDFDTAPFEIHENAVSHVLSFLSKSSADIGGPVHHCSP